MKAFAIAIILIASLHMQGHAQVAGDVPADRRLVEGQVVSDVDGSPLVGVHITLRGALGALAPTTQTDGFGRFSFTVPGARRYQAVARKAGFTTVVAAAAPNTAVLMRLQPRGVITGRVVDDAGEPVVDASVTASEPGGATSVTAITDDRGEYRLSVPPDRGLIVAVVTMGAFPESIAAGPNQFAVRPRMHTTYFPGSESANRAAAVRAGAGAVVPGIDFSIPTELSARQPLGALAGLPVPAPFLAEANPTDAEGVVQGRVLDTAGRALANTLVLLTGDRAGSATRLIRTDAGGNFEFRQVADGPARVMASKPGYAPDEARPVVGGGNGTDVSLQLTPWAAIGGRVVDEFGEPVEGARVQVLRARYNGVRQYLVPAGGIEPITDDGGSYRIYGLDPGTYIVSADVGVVRSADLDGYVRSYYLGSPASNLVQLRISPGQEIDGIDVQLTRASTFLVAGRMFKASGEPGSVGALQLWPSQRSGAIAGVPLDARVEADGRFEFRNVPDGDYVVQAYRGRINATTEGEFGALPVSVAGGNVTGLMLNTSAGSSISGTIVLDTLTATSEPSRAELEISPIPSDPDLAPTGNWAAAGVDPQWRFSLAGVNGPRRLLPTRLPRGWTLKEVRANGVDVTDRLLPFGSTANSLSEIEVVLTDRPAQLAGRVLDVRGQGIGGTRVVIFPPDRDAWYWGSRFLRDAVTQRDGTFTIVGMPPGNYYAAILPQTARDDIDWWRRTEVLDDLIPSSSFVWIAESERVAILLRR